MEYTQNAMTDGGQTVSTLQALMQNCKQEAKHLLEANVTNRKIHWTHPSFISFCTSVDDILCYGVHKKYRTANTTSKQWLTSSGRVLQELSKAFPVAASMYNMCYSSNTAQNSSEKSTTSSRPKPDYASLQSDSRSEYKILWIRTAILEKTLKPIVDEIMRKPELYYSKKSVLCHSVYSELFSFLLDGPCSLNFSRMRSIDTSVISPAPSEIINRYSRVFPTSSLGYATYQQDSFNSEVWGHIQSLYQTSVTTCLYGKNNIMMTPPKYSYPLEGYLTLIQFESSLLLKWLPNALINRKFEDTSPERFHILSLDITNDVAHIHCHQSNESKIIMIGYNGIGYPALSFPQPLSLTHFLESLENGLHPRGCLEPPLWFLRQQLHSPEKSKQATSPRNENGYPKIWNQVFRVRFGRQKQQDNGLPVQEVVEWDEMSDDEGSSPERHVSETVANLRRSRSKSPLKPVRVASFTNKRTQSSSNELERLQSKVSHQLVARYFYSWLSYCRHINRVKTSLSHLVTKPAPSILSNRQVEDNIDNPLPLSERDWAEFTSLRTNAAWGRVVWQIYEGGVAPSLRKEVWPYLLKVYSCEATQNEISEIVKSSSEGYRNTLRTWKELERKHYRNNDPTSTSMDIRLGLTTTSTGSHHQPEPPPVATHHIINTAADDGPDLIELGSNNDEDEEILVVTDTDVPVDDDVVPVDDTNVPVDDTNVPVDSTLVPVGNDSVPLADEVDVDSGCEDRPHTGTSSEGEGLHGAIMFTAGDAADDAAGDAADVPEPKLAPNEEKFLEELLKIDKDIPRCDRDYWYFQNPANLTKLRNVISSYIWRNIDGGYSQGMCDLLAPLLVTFDNEEMSFICFEKLMQTMDYYFPPKPGVQDRMNNLRSLLQILEGDFFQYLSELPMGDSLFYSYRWFLVNFKREFSYNDIFLLWETSWAAKWCSTEHFEVFVAMAIIQQYKSAIMDAQLDASEILNLFTDLSEKKAMNYFKTVSYARSVISHISQDSYV